MWVTWSVFVLIYCWHQTEGFFFFVFLSMFSSKCCLGSVERSKLCRWTVVIRAFLARPVPNEVAATMLTIPPVTTDSMVRSFFLFSSNSKWMTPYSFKKCIYSVLLFSQHAPWMGILCFPWRSQTLIQATWRSKVTQSVALWSPRQIRQFLRSESQSVVQRRRWCCLSTDLRSS